MHRFLSVAGALGAIHVLGVLAQDVPTCVASCASQVRADFTQFSCANADDAGCLCPNADFSNGIRDCSSPTCGATDADVLAYLSPDFCLNFPPPGASATESSSAVEPTTTTEAPATTTEAPESTTEAPETTSAPASSTTEEAVSESSTSTPASTSAAETTTASAETTSATPSATSSSATASDTPVVDGSKGDDGTKEEESDTGLSEGAKIGIAVGVTVAAIALAALAICLFMRRRKQTPQPRQQPIEISKPLPGSGPTYIPGGRDSYEKYENDIEMTTNRYEDMPPRQVPRTMV